jgi:FkbH-like protein
LTKFLTLSQIIAINRNNLESNSRKINVTILSNNFVAPLNEYIDYHLRSQGINSFSRLIDLISLEEQKMNIDPSDVIFIDYDIFNQLNYAPITFSSVDIFDGEAIQKTQLEISRMMSLIPKKAMIIFKLFNTSHITQKFKKLTNIDKTAFYLNNWLIETYPEFHYLDAGKLEIIDSLPAFPRIENVKRNYSHAYHDKLSTAIMEIVLEVGSPVKKVLLLDCDGTLWQGLIGEQRVDDLIFYHEIHKLIKMLKNCGVIICFVTKNDELNIEKFFNHSHILKKEDVYKVFAGWGPKSISIQKIALELNLNYDSMIFIDDNLVEINEVKNFAPNIGTLLVNPVYDIYLKEFAALTTLFIRSRVTNEDRLRALDYQSNSRRTSDKNLYKNEFEYLKSLCMRVQIKSNKNVDFNRVSQLLSRTNQFNLTQLQLNPEEVSRLASNENVRMLTFELSDKYSDLGVVCVCLLTMNDKSIMIDNINLSCRAFGRKLEFLVMNEVVEIAKRSRKGKIEGRFIPSTKNQYCNSFFLENGFQLIEENSEFRKFSIQSNNFIDQPNIFQLFEVNS